MKTTTMGLMEKDVKVCGLSVICILRRITCFLFLVILMHTQKWDRKYGRNYKQNIVMRH